VYCVVLRCENLIACVIWFDGEDEVGLAVGLAVGIDGGGVGDDGEEGGR